MKKIIALLLIIALSTSVASCSNALDETVPMEPRISQMQSICELSVMECYYHNVAKYQQEDAEGWWLWKKDKRFWIEYSGIVKMGIDAALVDIQVEGTQITITLPEAKVLGCKIDSASLTKESYIVDKNSAQIQAEDETFAFEQAQIKLEEAASSNKALLKEAQQRAKTLLEDYIKNIGAAVGNQYSVTWIYTDENGIPLDKLDSDKTEEQATESTTQAS